MSRRSFSEEGARNQDRIVYASLVAAAMPIVVVAISLLRFIAR